MKCLRVVFHPGYNIELVTIENTSWSGMDFSRTHPSPSSYLEYLPYAVFDEHGTLLRQFKQRAQIVVLTL